LLQIEHPFGAEPHDLPLEHICIAIEKNLLEILRRAESREVRLAERRMERDSGLNGSSSSFGIGVN